MGDTKRTPTSAEQPFLETAPPHWSVRGLGYLLITLFLVATLAAVIIHVPETISSPFVLVPVGGTDPLRAPHDGFVSMRVSDGQAVKQGDVLFLVRSAAAGDRSSELEASKVQRDGAAESLANAEQKYALQQRADEEEIRRLKTRIDSLIRRLELTKKFQALQKTVQASSLQMVEREIEGLKHEVDSRRKIRDAALEVTNRADRLSQSRAISEMEFFRIRQETERSKLEFDLSERASAAARMRREQLLKEHASQEESWALTVEQLEAERQDTDSLLAKAKHQSAVAAREQEELKRSLSETRQKACIRIAALLRELDRSQDNEVSVPAPCAGTVLRLQVKGNGAFVRTGDVLCELAPADKELQAELSVTGAGIGRITADQRAKLLYEAFPYQRHGVKHGTVRWVSPGSVVQSDGPIFRVLVEVDERTVRVDGEDRPLRPGMGGRAEVVVGRRSLISYAFEPLRQLKETMGDAPPKP